MNRAKLIIVIVAALVLASAIGFGIGMSIANKAADKKNAAEQAASEVKKEAEVKDGWKEEDGKKYYYKDNEKMTDWFNEDGNWYYLGKDGSVKYGWQQILSNNYYFNEEGIMQTGWVKDSNGTFYCDENGKMVTGWRDIDNNRYFFGSNGKMFTDTTIEGNYLGKDGIMQKYSVNSFDEARNLIMKNDGVYVKQKMNTNDSIVKLDNFKEGYVTKDILQGWTFPNEEYYFLTLSVYDLSGEELYYNIGLYLVGKESGKVYVVPFEGGKYSYRIENNSILERIPYENGDCYEWR